MHEALIYQPGARLSLAELMAARLDGHVIEVGPAFMPFDTLETVAARTLSLAPRLGGASEALAIVNASAAWVHGGLATHPQLLHLQRTGASYARPSRAVDIRYQPAILGKRERERIVGIWVSTRERTLADLCRRPDLNAHEAALGMLLAFPELGAQIRGVLGPLAIAHLDRAEQDAAMHREEARLRVSSTLPARHHRRRRSAGQH